MKKYRGNPWAVLLVVSLGFFMTLLDLTIVNIAIPNMISKLHASLDDILWVINAYALVLAVLLITAGRLGDLLGQRRMFFAGVVVFTVASAACGLAPGAGWLIAFRAVQGLGAAMLMPQTLAILTMVFPPERRGAAFGVWGAVAGVATIAGPTLGGLLVTGFDWRYIFFINVPVGVVVLVLTLIIIPDLRTGQRHSFDVSGVLLASAALLAICYALVEGQKYNWGTITSFISIPLHPRRRRRAARRLPAGPGQPAGRASRWFRSRCSGPELRADELRGRVSSPSACSASSCRSRIYLQSVLGFSALKAGLTMAPASVVSMFVAPVAGRMSDRIGGKYILMPGLIAVRRRHGLHRADRPARLGLVRLPRCRSSSAGIGIGCTFAPMTTIAMRNVKPLMAGAASGVFNTTRQVGTVIGTAGVGALLQNRLVVVADQPGCSSAARSLPAAGPREARQRIPGGGQERPRGRLRRTSRPGLAARSSPTASSTRCGRRCWCRSLFLLVGAASCVFIMRQPAARQRPAQRRRDRAAAARLG